MKNWIIMAIDLAEQLSRINGKAQLLLIRYNALRGKVESLTSENQELRAVILAREAEIEKLKTEMEYLRIASTVDPDRKTKESVYTMLSDIVREIDRCVADLKE